MRLKLFLSILLFCAITKAQTSSELKDFITKNSVAIRTVQKNMIREAASSYASNFKHILKNQEAAVKLYNTDKEASFYFAFLARTESLDFLKKHTKGSTEYFEITDAEKNYKKKSSEDISKALSVDEIKTIDNIDALNAQSLNNITLTIQ
ncbi:MAG: hypothetical protein U0W65_06865 [Bacteroidia bacterium]|nr:hypothetical protein [Bacteroidia bacterium]